MKKVCTLVLFILLTSSAAYSQMHEVGILTSGLNSFGMVYKVQTSENRYLAHKLGVADVRLDFTENANTVNAQMGYALGFEKRRALNEKLLFVHGFQPAFSLAMSYADNTNLLLRPSLGYILGFQYNFNEFFYLSLETVPSLSANWVYEEERVNSVAINAGYASNVAAITLAYRFEKSK